MILFGILSSQVSPNRILSKANFKSESSLVFFLPKILLKSQSASLDKEEEAKSIKKRGGLGPGIDAR